MPLNNGFKIVTPDSPLAIPGLMAYYDDADSRNFEFNIGNQVKTWFDLSGNGLHATQSVSANQPSYTGGRLVFDGVLTYFNCPLRYDWQGKDFTIYTVQNGNGVTNAFRGVFTNRPGFGVWLTIGHSLSSDSFLLEFGAGGTTSPSPSFADRSANDFIFTMIRETTPRITLRINNGSEAISTYPAALGGITQSTFIGFWGGVPQVWEGPIRTLAFFNGRVTDAENTRIITHLSNTKGIEV